MRRQTAHWQKALALGSIAMLLNVSVPAQTLLGEGPALGAFEQRFTQADIETATLTDIRAEGMKMFTVMFNRQDGFGDGPMDPIAPHLPGGRPTLNNNGTMLRVNGLDGQSCLECHSIVSTATVPFTSGVGGAGGIASTPMRQPKLIDVEDALGNGFAEFDGRMINPPALFGAGGVQLIAKEMTKQLQRLKARALAQPQQPVPLYAKGIYFGTIVADAEGNLDTSQVEGIDTDLVVRPFGRKGEFTSVRDFALGALMFHMGLQPVEIVGADFDADGDGVDNEILIGEASALEIFLTTQETPFREPLDRSGREGAFLFLTLGCNDCHRSALRARSAVLKYSYPEVPDDPNANVYYSVDLAKQPMLFPPRRREGIWVPMFSDLKRHDMGPELAEHFHGVDEQTNREFITAKLWGVADTAPYLHDGRALTLNEAIVLHGGEALAAREAYQALSTADKNRLLKFLMSLRNPVDPNLDVVAH